jgi:hypothetical protein
MNRFARRLLRKRVERALKQHGFKFDFKNENILEHLEAAGISISTVLERPAEFTEVMRTFNEKLQPNLDEMVAELPMTAYEVLLTCDTCGGVDITTVPTEAHAVTMAIKKHRMVMDDDGVPHNYRCAIVKVSREIAALDTEDPRYSGREMTPDNIGKMTDEFKAFLEQFEQQMKEDGIDPDDLMGWGE